MKTKLNLCKVMLLPIMAVILSAFSFSVQATEGFLPPDAFEFSDEEPHSPSDPILLNFPERLYLGFVGQVNF